MHTTETGGHISGLSGISGKFLYVDCSSGISGDMFIAALTDLAAKCGLAEEAAGGKHPQPCGAGTRPDAQPAGGLPGVLAQLQELFRAAGINISLVLKPQERISGPGLHLDVLWPEGQPLRHLDDLTGIIAKLDAAPAVRERASRMLERLAWAEAKAHGVDVSQVHFHEVGAIDTLVDVFGACWLLDRLGISELYSTALPWFGGFVDCSHGRMALPAPATLDLMRGKPFVMTGAEEELITPTGALLLDGLVNWGCEADNGPAHQAHSAQPAHGHSHSYGPEHGHGHAHPHGAEHGHAHEHHHHHDHSHHGHQHGEPSAHTHEHHHHAHCQQPGAMPGGGLVPAFPAGARYLGCGVGYGSREPSARSDWPGRGLRLHLFGKPDFCRGTGHF